MFRPSARLTVENAKAALETGLRAIEGGQIRIDLSDITIVDSSAVATLLAWQRAAQKRGAALSFVNLSANLNSLVTLYGVTQLLGPASEPETQSTDKFESLHH
jgi:phospholipid transport system transporter-binding protein